MDLIDRQAAIDALEKSGYCYDQFLGVESVLNALPSAHSCETCRYNHLEWFEEPCDSCTGGGESNHWKPKEPEGDPCEGCKHIGKDIYEYPCDSCVHGGATCRWEDSYE